MTRHKYYAIAMVPCNFCDGTNTRHITDSDGTYSESCPECDARGRVEVRVPLVKALKELQVSGFYVE